jgi:predicted neuraminidase
MRELVTRKHCRRLTSLAPCRGLCLGLLLAFCVPSGSSVAAAKLPDIAVERIFGPEHPDKYKHPASFTELANGDLYLAYYGGSGEYGEDTWVRGSRLVKGTTQWTAPEIIADTPFRSDGNPVIWQAPDGVVWLFYVVRYGPTWSNSRIKFKVSLDNAKTWSDSDMLTWEEGTMVRGRPIALNNGDYLLGVYHETGGDRNEVGADTTSFFLRKKKGENQWTPTKRIHSRIGNLQPSVVQITDDYLVAYSRRGGGYGPLPDGFLVRTESRDGGFTWSDGTDSQFPNPNAAADFIKLANGHLALVYNDNNQGERMPLTVAISTDNDKSYPYRRNIVNKPGDTAAYPVAIQTQDGKIHVIYTSEKRTVINHVVFDESEILKAPQAAAVSTSKATAAPRHVPVYDVDGMFGGWPANHGIWSWGNEIVVGLSIGYYRNLGPDRHAIDRERPEECALARSLDGGETWSIEYPGRKGILVGPAGFRHGTLPPGQREPEPVDCPGGIDFTHPNFAMTLRMGHKDHGESRFYYSTDRARTWKGPFRLPMCGQTGVMARTDYLVNGKHDCTLILTASKSNGLEGRIFCARTTDGGKTWNFVSYVGPEPAGYSIMPSTVRLSASDLLTTIRCREGEPSWIEAWVSHNDGTSWSFLNRPEPDTGEGNPPATILLKDGRVCMTYGVRKAPFSMEARLSSDNGTTWNQPIVLRDDGGGRDIGYPRSVQRPDGKVVTIYYFTPKTDVDRSIQATIWDPGVR